MFNLRTWFTAALLASTTLATPALAADTAPSALVRVAPPVHRTLSEQLTGYGTVSAATGEASDVALPRAGRLTRLAVNAGQRVTRGQVLFQFATGAADALAYRQALANLALARDQNSRSVQLYAQKLITASQLAAARKALIDAEAALRAQRQLGSGRTTEQVKAPFAGIVTAVSAAQGDYLAAGVAVLKLQRARDQQVQLGIEPEDVTRVQVGMAVRIASVFNAADSVTVQVAAVYGTINPRTRLVDVLVRLSGAQAHFLNGTRVSGAITVRTEAVTAVPRSAVLRDDRGAYLFQVRDGQAVRVAVKTGIEADGLIAVSGPLDPTLPVVTLGNYELRDGMAVREAQR